MIVIVHSFNENVNELGNLTLQRVAVFVVE